MVQDSTTYYVWIGGSCDYGHKEPTHEARAETKLVWALPCKKEEDESQPTHVSVPRETGETKGVKSRDQTCLISALVCTVFRHYPNKFGFCSRCSFISNLEWFVFCLFCSYKDTKFFSISVIFCNLFYTQFFILSHTFKGLETSVIFSLITSR